MLCLCSKTYFCYDQKSNNYKFSSKGVNKQTLEACDDGPMSKYRKVIDELVNATSTNKRFQTVELGVATYEQTQKRLSYLYPKRFVEDDGIHTKPLYFQIYPSNFLCSFLYILISFLTLYYNF